MDTDYFLFIPAIKTTIEMKDSKTTLCIKKIRVNLRQSVVTSLLRLAQAIDQSVVFETLGAKIEDQSKFQSRSL